MLLVIVSLLKGYVCGIGFYELNGVIMGWEEDAG